MAVILITTLTKQFWQLLCHLFPERNTSENEDAVNAKEEAAICRIDTVTILLYLPILSSLCTSSE